jgi:hypothetical protein
MKSADTGSDHDSVIAFVHIPKTAGTTLNAILARAYSPDQTCEIMMRGMSLRVPSAMMLRKRTVSFSKIRRLKSALKHRPGVRLIRGHFDLSLDKLLPADTRFFTLLRDPVERAVSHYYHYRRQKSDPIHPLAMRSTLTEWVGSCGLVEMDNGQTRRLAGAMNLPCGRVTPQTLERAKSALARNFEVVGLTERFDESLILLHRAFNWPLYRFAAHNVGDCRTQHACLSEEELNAIEACNRFDLDLYRFACALFEQAVSEIDMPGELARLRAAPNYVAPKPAALPLAQASRFDLLAGLRAARALGIRRLKELRLRAHRVIG